MPRRSVSRRRFVAGAGAAGAALGSAAAAAPTSQRSGISPQAVGELAAGAPAQTAPPAPIPTQAAPQGTATGPGPPLSDTRDVEFAHRGFIATRDDPMIRNAQGRVI